MYLWYKEAGICYAYLSDVSLALHPRDYVGSFRQSKWFTRGWTLQEIIAPCSVEFYSQEWRAFGTRLSLQQHISQVTGIDVNVLRGEPYEDYPVAQKMSWAAKRRTTKPEDIAYCLMGIFSVNMPLLYGEGESEAFFRLQREIMNRTEDHTLFVWHEGGSVRAEQGLLANSPSAFAPTSMYEPSQLIRTNYAWEDADSEPPALTGRGLRIQLCKLEVSGHTVALLDVELGATKKRACIYLHPECGEPFRRRMPQNCKFEDVTAFPKTKTSKVYIHQTYPGLQDISPPSPMNSFIIVSAESNFAVPRSLEVHHTYGTLVCTEKEWYSRLFVDSGATVKFQFDPASDYQQHIGPFCVTFGINQSLLPWCEVDFDNASTHGPRQIESYKNIDVSTRTVLGPNAHVDRLTKRLKNSCELSVVVKRRPQVRGDPSPNISQMTIEEHVRWYIYTLRVSLHTPSLLASTSASATAGASRTASSSSGPPRLLPVEGSESGLPQVALDPTSSLHAIIPRSMTDDLAGMGFFQ